MCAYCDWPGSTQLAPCSDCSKSSGATCSRCEGILALAAQHNLVVEGGRVMRRCPYCPTLRSADLTEGTCEGCAARFFTLPRLSAEPSRA